MVGWCRSCGWGVSYAIQSNTILIQPSLEAELAQARNKMALGLKDPATGEFKAASSVQVRTALRSQHAMQ